MPTWKLTIEYEGTRYSGWQAQANTTKTVQGHLQRAAAEILGSVTIGGSGRTDAGVHALAQVAHLRASTGIRPLELQHGLNDRLPHDIHVLAVEETKNGFHARHDATARVYLYQIATRRSALAKAFIWWIRDRLDLEAMQNVATMFPGKHDFAAFSDKRVAGESTLVVVDRMEIGVDGDLILIRIGASHFLWKMVRKVVAALVEVGTGRQSPDAIRSAIASGTPRVGPTAPPSGLFLEAVLYEGDTFERPLRAIVPVVSPSNMKERTWDRASRR